MTAVTLTLVILKKFREYFNGHEYAKRQCLKAGIAFTSLDNAFGTAGDPAAVQRICDGLTDQKIYRFAGKWLARLPQPFTRADEDADYRWQLSVKQIELYPFRPVIDQEACGGIQGFPAMASRRASRGWMPWLRAVPR